MQLSNSMKGYVTEDELFYSLLTLSLQDSVPAGLTKDKKRIKGQEISVHLAWQSTLYVTNFPEKADDVFIRQLFEPVNFLCCL